jgi:YesN/AraC family two-component response regulator
VKDVAELLHTNSTYVSACLNAQLGKSFPDFVNSYRVRYAQQLMREHPSMGYAQISEESGFSGENAFFRTFKAHTGVTPSAWKSGL